MISKVVRKIEFDELEEMLRNVPLKGKDESGNQIFVYKDAKISLRENVDPNEVNPTTFYLLRENTERQKLIRRELLEKGYDSLHLTGALEILNDTNEKWLLAPPIIEVTQRVVKYKRQDGEIAYRSSFKLQIPIINDGAHRVSLAMKSKETFNAVWISGVNQNYSHAFYAHPNGWDMVKTVDSVPSTKEGKKLYRLPEVYNVYRDFGVIGCGGPRGFGDKKK